MARVQAGIVAKRDAAGNFLPARPIYKEDKEEKQSGLTKTEEQCCEQFGKFMFEKYLKPYIEECQKEGIDPFAAI